MGHAEGVDPLPAAPRGEGAEVARVAPRGLGREVPELSQLRHEVAHEPFEAVLGGVARRRRILGRPRRRGASRLSGWDGAAHYESAPAKSSGLVAR